MRTTKNLLVMIMLSAAWGWCWGCTDSDPDFLPGEPATTDTVGGAEVGEGGGPGTEPPSDDGVIPEPNDAAGVDGTPMDGGGPGGGVDAGGSDTDSPGFPDGTPLPDGVELPT